MHGTRNSFTLLRLFQLNVSVSECMKETLSATIFQVLLKQKLSVSANKNLSMEVKKGTSLDITHLAFNLYQMVEISIFQSVSVWSSMTFCTRIRSFESTSFLADNSNSFFTVAEHRKNVHRHPKKALPNYYFANHMKCQLKCICIYSTLFTLPFFTFSMGFWLLRCWYNFCLFANVKIKWSVMQYLSERAVSSPAVKDSVVRFFIVQVSSRRKTMC